MRFSVLKKGVLLCFVLFWCLAGGPGKEALAQHVGKPGVQVGYARASLGSNLGDTDATGGWMGGLFLPVRLDQALTIEPALLYTRKGGQTQFALEDGSLSDAQYHLDYLELPVLGRLSFPLSRSFDAYLGLGPYAGLLVHQSTDAEVAEEQIVTSDQFGDWDYGVVGELGVEVPVGGQALLLGARYEYGIADLYKENFKDSPGSVQIDRQIGTRTLFITAGLRF